MLFNTPLFLCFFVVFFAIYLVACPTKQWRLRVITIASLIFYGAWNYKFLPLLVFSASVDFFCARRIEKEKKLGATGKRWLIVSVCTNLSVLGFFKYFNFFIESLSEGLALIGLSIAIPHLEIVLPLGISFYTFQSMSYTVDVYRGSTPVCRSPLLFFSSLSFFPQLIAGPIVRAADLVPQLEQGPIINETRWRTGMMLIALGLTKKTIADVLGPIADTFFAQAQNPSDWISAWTGALAFTGQIYGDFSGYSDIAIGLGLLLGYKFPPNFNLPYLASSIAEFWRRWHISLSTWLRDYLYVPLGGNKKGNRVVNVMITMVLGGLWHGANYTFIFWGLYHGILISVSQAIQKLVSPKDRAAKYTKPFAILFTFYLTVVGWVLFRAETLSQALRVLRDMHWGETPSVVYWPMALNCMLAVSGLVFCHLIDAAFASKHRPVFLRFPILFFVLVLSLTFTFSIGSSGYDFIYFQF